MASAEATVDMVAVPLMARQDSTVLTAVEETLVITLVRTLSKLVVVASAWAMLNATAWQQRQGGRCLSDAAGHSGAAENTVLTGMPPCTDNYSSVRATLHAVCSGLWWLWRSRAKQHVAFC